MPNKKPLVIVTRRLPDAIETRMRELFDAKLNVDDVAMTREQLIDAVQRADVIVPTVTDRLDARILSRAGERRERQSQHRRHRAIRLVNAAHLDDGLAHG